MKPFDYLIDLVEDTRHAFMQARRDITGEEAGAVVNGTRALLRATRRKAQREAEEQTEELKNAEFLQAQFEAAVAIFNFQEVI